MGKLEIACLIAVRLEGAAMFLSGARMEPSQAPKGIQSECRHHSGCGSIRR
ncbi:MULTISPECIES: hypothetical protein [Paenibacillus]|uniref:hypothetical protein n=1 Tax=Paenibacillus TaxID=44249 RepID=UPI001575005F|nr:hypothetical protein [Paenibacillus sp. JMULE4]